MTRVSLTAVDAMYGASPALSGVTIEISDGQILGVIGASGSGKTTLLRCIAGFHTPTAGSVTIGDQVVFGDHANVPAHRRRVGYVPQEGALFPHLSVGENLGFGLPRRDRTRSTLGALLESVSLDPNWLERRPQQLSGGEQQRVALARSLATTPAVILLDEPFSALDAGLREQTREVVTEILREHRMTTVLVTHDQQEALSFSDQVAVLRAGVVAQSGAPHTVYRRPVDLPTARFVGDTIECEGIVDGGSILTPFGALPRGEHIDTAAGGSTGERRQVALRPEQLALHRSAGDEESHYDVVRTVFEGPVVAVHLRSTRPDLLSGTVRTHPDVDLVVGDRVTATVTGGPVAVGPVTVGPVTVGPPSRPHPGRGCSSRSSMFGGRQPR